MCASRQPTIYNSKGFQDIQELVYYIRNSNN